MLEVLEMNKEEFFDWPLKEIRVKSKLLFYGSVYELEEYVDIAEKCVSLVKSSESIRLIVLETWLFIDYSIRQLIMGALDLTRYNHEDYDLQYNLLPRSFEACLTLLVRLKNSNEKLPSNPEHGRVLLPGRFAFFLMKEHRQTFDELIEAEREYYRKFFPSLLPHENDGTEAISLSPVKVTSHSYRRLSDDWLEAVADIDEEWSKKASKLNAARNLAAHSHDVPKIVARMGYSGENANQHVKNHCLELLEQMIGIVAKAGEEPGDPNPGNSR